MSGPHDALLEVQAHDTRLDQIDHLLENLPARADRDAAADAVATAETQIDVVSTQRDDLGRQQKRLDDEIASIEAKRVSVNETLYGGSVTSAGELQDLSKEVEALSRRISQLEDQDIEFMEQLEPVDADLVRLTTDREQHTATLDQAEQQLIAVEAELAAERATEQSARDAVAGGIGAELLTEYDSLRGGRGGIGVAKLIGTQCGGCHLTLSAVEAARIRKHPEAVTHCEECGRLLVP